MQKSLIVDSKEVQSLLHVQFETHMVYLHPLAVLALIYSENEELFHPQVNHHATNLHTESFYALKDIVLDSIKTKEVKLSNTKYVTVLYELEINETDVSLYNVNDNSQMSTNHYAKYADAKSMDTFKENVKKVQQLDIGSFDTFESYRNEVLQLIDLHRFGILDGLHRNICFCQLFSDPDYKLWSRQCFLNAGSVQCEAYYRSSPASTTNVLNDNQCTKLLKQFSSVLTCDLSKGVFHTLSDSFEDFLTMLIEMNTYIFDGTIAEEKDRGICYIIKKKKYQQVRDIKVDIKNCLYSILFRCLFKSQEYQKIALLTFDESSPVEDQLPPLTKPYSDYMEQQTHFLTIKSIGQTVCGTVDVQGRNSAFRFKALVLVRVLESALHTKQHACTLLKNIRSITNKRNLITTPRLVFMQGLADIICQTYFMTFQKSPQVKTLKLKILTARKVVSAEIMFMLLDGLSWLSDQSTKDVDKMKTFAQDNMIEVQDFAKFPLPNEETSEDILLSLYVNYLWHLVQVPQVVCDTEQCMSIHIDNIEQDTKNCFKPTYPFDKWMPGVVSITKHILPPSSVGPGTETLQVSNYVTNVLDTSIDDEDPTNFETFTIQLPTYFKNTMQQFLLIVNDVTYNNSDEYNRSWNICDPSKSLTTLFELPDNHFVPPKNGKRARDPNAEKLQPPKASKIPAISNPNIPKKKIADIPQPSIPDIPKATIDDAIQRPQSKTTSEFIPVVEKMIEGAHSDNVKIALQSIIDHYKKILKKYDNEKHGLKKEIQNQYNKYHETDEE